MILKGKFFELRESLTDFVNCYIDLIGKGNNFKITKLNQSLEQEIERVEEKLINLEEFAISKGHRGAYWHILKKLSG